MNLNYPNHTDASELEDGLHLACDVVICGSGAGGAVAAEILAEAGKSVIILEEGPLKTAQDFSLHEKSAYSDLYQESAGRKTQDGGINILQGRAVGGSTTVNWTSSFRTPPQTLTHWQEMGVQGLSEETLKPWFETMEARLNVSSWAQPPNENNAAIARGASALGLSPLTIARNVKGCADLGYCGLGCPLNAKQSMLVSCIPSALKLGARLISRCRAERVQLQGDRASGVLAYAMDARGQVRPDIALTIDADTVIVSGGAINSPALLLRSKLPDPYQRVGKRTFLHPVPVVAAVMPTAVNAYQGAPQSIYVNDFLWRDGVAGKVGYKLEASPIHPVLAATAFSDFGAAHQAVMRDFTHLQATLALLRDGFHEDSQGGAVTLDRYAYPLLDYPITDYLWEGIQHAWLNMVELSFAAGATKVRPLHVDADNYTRFSDARAAVKALPLKTLRAKLLSAHVMGGCAMGEVVETSVVDSRGRYHHLHGLYVLDGSIFPTSIGANPQLSIYALVAKLSHALLA